MNLAHFDSNSKTTDKGSLQNSVSVDKHDKTASTDQLELKKPDS